MRLKTYIDEAVYGIELAALIKKHRNDTSYIVFTDETLPKERQVRNMPGLMAVVAYPAKFIYNMARRGQPLGIKGWVGARRLAVIELLRGQVLDTKRYEAERYEADVDKLRKFFIADGFTEEQWKILRYECAKETPRSLFRRLCLIMKQVSEKTGYSLNKLFNVINFAAIYSHGDVSLETNNPELYVLNYRNIKKIDNIDF